MSSEDIYSAIINRAPKNASHHEIYRYTSFIIRCVDHNINTNFNDVGYENHHILPRSLFPEYQCFSSFPWNKARLSYRQHIIAHWMLARIFGGDMNRTLWYMSNGACLYKHRIGFPKVSSRMYSESRRRFSEDQSKRSIELWKNEEYREKMSKMRTELWQDNDLRERSIEKMKESWTTERREDQAVRAKAHMEKMHSDPEFMLKLSEAGRKTALFLNSDPEILEKKRKASSKTLHELNKRRRTCEYCNKPFSLGMYARWHGDNCKSKN